MAAVSCSFRKIWPWCRLEGRAAGALGCPRSLSVSYLFISHDLRVVAYTSHRIAVMYLGRIVEMGPAKEVSERRLHPYTHALFGSLAGEGKKEKPRRVLSGGPPSPLDPPRGCVFHTRCPKVEKGRCDVETPELMEIVPGSHHRVACFHPEGMDEMPGQGTVTKKEEPAVSST